MKKKNIIIIISALFSCILMAIVDGIIMPGYIIKSKVKIITFLLYLLFAQEFLKTSILKSFL